MNGSCTHLELTKMWFESKVGLQINFRYKTHNWINIQIFVQFCFKFLSTRKTLKAGTKRGLESLTYFPDN